MENAKPSPYLIIVPTYNERPNIRPLVSKVLAASAEVDLLFVDDNSQDGTAQEIGLLQKEWPERIHLIKRPGKLGLGSAYVEGFHWGLSQHYRALLEMDADLSHNPLYLKDFLEKLQSFEVVVGSRYIAGGGTQNWSLVRKWISLAGSQYARLILGLNVRDLTGGFNGWRREVLEAIDLPSIHSDGYCFQIELKYRALVAGFSLVETPIVFEDRRAGQSKMSFAIVLEAVMKVVVLRFLKHKMPRRKPWPETIG